MRQFIDTTKHDFWTALVGDGVINSLLKPKPYRDHRELTFNERAIFSCKFHTAILLFNIPNNKDLLNKSLANFICDDYPDLAAKHKLVIDRRHEYWRPS